MADPLVRVEQISFRFSGAPRAVPLSHQDGVAIRQPEWKRDPRRSEPAAYVRPASGRTITIKAVFSCSDPTIRSVQVRARRTGGSGFVGDVGDVAVRFTRGRSEKVTCRVSCSTFKGVALERVSWQWQYKIAARWTSTDRSDHEIALVLARPEAPWKRIRAWWEVMRLACEAASGSMTLAGAATDVAATVFRVWGGTYFSWDPGEHYATDVGERPLRFDCAKFLDLFNDGNADATVDCSDVAAIASTFAGILGCPLRQLAITTSVPTNFVRLVGQRTWRSKRFGLHEFAISGAARRALGSRPRIWDACVEVSGDRTIVPKKRPYTSLLPASLAPGNYLFRLLGLRRGRLKDVINERPLVRPIGQLPTSVRPVSAVFDKHLSRVADEYNFKRWSDPMQTAQVLRFALPTLSGWTLIKPVTDQQASPQPGSELVVRVLWRRSTGPKQLIAAHVYVCATAAAARRRLVAVLGRFSGVTLEPLQTVLPEIQSSASVNQEMQFATPNGSAIVASYLNAVIVVRRATPGTSVIPDVRAFFQEIGSQLVTATQPMARVRARSSTGRASSPRGRRRRGRHQR
jgi:hypothetical protein